MGFKKIILGDDPFLGWKDPFKKFNSDKKRCEKYREVLDFAYKFGIKYFLVSNYEPLRKELKKFYYLHNEIICIANIDLYSHYYFKDGISAWDLKNFNSLKKIVFANVGYYNSYFKNCINDDKKYSIEKIFFDEKEYIKNVRKFDFCKYFIVGNLAYDYLLITKQYDIIKKEISLLNKFKKIPIGISELGKNTFKIWNDIFGIKNILVNCEVDYNYGDEYIIGYKTLVIKNGFLDRKLTNKKWKNLSNLLVGIGNLKEAKETLYLLNEYNK